MCQSLLSLWTGCACGWAPWLMPWHQRWKVPPSGHITTIVFWIWVLDDLWKLITHKHVHCRPPHQPASCALGRTSSQNEIPVTCPQRGTFWTYHILMLVGLMSKLLLQMLNALVANKLDPETAVPADEHTADRFQHFLNLWAPDILEEVTFQISSLPEKFMGLYKLFSQELLKSLYLALCLK